MLLFLYIVISNVNFKWMIKIQFGVVKKDHLNKRAHSNAI